ncbi:hypothetical protein VB774_09745 [Pseudanabaena galeata UHCC 0370]|uniref:Uncharacterized protein n=1 Tax=Pseudanabaena galeata UHCC 0370 TaxID=3110310 RepID=A0ABU5TI05_9CYAN|nr:MULTISPECIES: hypothetical protein [Pseudanabaena]MEA5477901.1 hypothetical protein [Pseudanabaena galeata UHCC 0370]MEA5487153.1 hypothetical protein [Pseudanabaena sp. CCNP1317]WGS75192.1 hypothetical protein OA858_24855 [Pseudanabaena galeata CCNP1313]
MKTKLFTQELNTGDITVISNLTSVTANCTRISRVEEVQDHEQESPSAIYIDLTIKQSAKLHDVLEATEEVDLVMSLEDSVELGLLMVAMGMEHKTDENIAATMSRLSQLIAEYR